MVSKIGSLAFAACLAFVGASPALAHHSFAMFDKTKTVTLVGVVKDFQFTNPHSWVELIVSTPSGGTENWTVETLSPNVLARSGWKRNSILPGQKATLLIYPMKDGSKGGNLISVTLPNGVVLGGGAG